jgi:PAS domain S-box-containing protein
MTASLDHFAQRQIALANFGEFALRCNNLQTILQEGCQIVAGALNTDLAKILELEPNGQTALVRAGVGWREGIVGTKRVFLDEKSSEAFAIYECVPIITQNLATEDRFQFPDFLLEHGVVALVNVPIFLPGGRPYGLIEVDAQEPRAFSDGDVQFLRTYASVLGPVIDRLFKIDDLARSNERFRMVVENARGFAILMTDADDIVTDWFPGAEETFGWSEAEMIGRSVSTIFTDQDKEDGAPEWETHTAAAKGKAPDVRWHVTKAGKRVFLDGQTIALRNQDGSLQGFLKIAQNLTERKRMEERQAVLLAELQHRVRNVLAMVAAVIQRGDIEVTTREFRDRLSGRIAAMARTQALLTRGAGAGVSLEGMIRDELLTLGTEEDRFAVTGPPITLAPKAAEVLTLAVHELATNASKYGALSQAGGDIDVRWTTGEKSGQTWLDFRWSETGIELDAAISKQKGFGTELITRRVPYELLGNGEMKFETDGLRCHLAFPLIAGESIFEEGITPGSHLDEGLV